MISVKGIHFSPMPPQRPFASISELGLLRAQWGYQSLTYVPGHQVKWQKFILRTHGPQDLCNINCQLDKAS